MIEKRISDEGFKIRCDKCPGEFLSMKSTTKTVTIGRKPIVTKMDKITGANIPVFSKCSGTLTKICTPALTDWVDVAESTINSEKFIPLVEQSELICTAGGGFVGFEPEPAKSEIMGPKKPNIVDQAKAKINGVANKAANMAKNATEGVTTGVGTALDNLKPIGQIFDTPAMQNMIKGATGVLNQTNLSKEQIDQQLVSLEQKVPELKSQISQTINGIKVPSLEDTGVFDMADASMESSEQAFIRQGIQDSINTLEGHFNTKINTASLINLDENARGGMSVPMLSDKGPLENWLDQKKIEQENLEKIATVEYDRITEQVTTINKDASFDNGEDSKKALSLLYSLYIPSQSGPTPIPDKGEVSKILTNKAKDKAQGAIDKNITRSKATINTKIQSEFDEKLKELGYDKAQKKIDKAQAESAELQKDMDKAEKYLGRMDNFGGYIDGLKEKYIGKITGRYDTAIAKSGQNLGLLNVSMDGMSFIADGLPPGDVVTNVKPKKEKEKSNEEDGENESKDGKNGTAGAVGETGEEEEKKPILRAYWGTPKTI
ncbi:PAAR-like protein [Aquimarina sp. M1]